MTKEKKQKYYVVKNIEEQYSVWPSDQKVPLGWEKIGDPKSKEECLDKIENLWTDMQPLSVRK